MLLIAGFSVEQYGSLKPYPSWSMKEEPRTRRPASDQTSSSFSLV